MGARLGPALEDARSDRDQAEFGPVAEVPLEVVQEAPDEIAPQVDPFLQTAVGAAQRLAEKVDALGVVGGGDPVLGHHDRAPAHGGGPAHAVLHAPGPVLVAHLGEADRGIVGVDALGPEVHSGVALHADEVVACGGAQEDVLEHLLRPVAQGLATLVGDDLGHRQGEADGEAARPRSQLVDGQAVGPDHGVVDRPEAVEVLLDARRVLTLEVPHDADDIGLVDGAGPTDEVAQVGGGPGHVSSEALWRVGRLPPSPGRQPERGGEVVEGDHGRDAVAEQGGADAPVVLERGHRELTLGGFDATPLEREAVGAHAHVGDQLHVLAPTGERVAGVAAGLERARLGIVLPGPPVVVDVAPLDLVGRRGDAPEKVGREDDLVFVAGHGRAG